MRQEEPVEFLVFRVTERNRVQDRVVLGGAWNEKVVRDYVTDNLSFLQDARTRICPAELAPKHVRKCKVQPWEGYLAQNPDETHLYDICDEISEAEDDAFRLSLEYLKKKPVAALPFLKGILEKNVKNQQYLAHVISERYCPLAPNPLMTRPADGDDFLPVIEPEKTLEDLENEFASAERLCTEIQNQINRLEAEGKNGIPPRFWDYLDTLLKDGADSDSLAPTEDTNDGTADCTPAVADGDDAQPPVEEQNPEPDWRSYPNFTKADVKRRRIAMSKAGWMPAVISRWERNRENGLKLTDDKPPMIVCKDGTLATTPGAIGKQVKRPAKKS